VGRHQAVVLYVVALFVLVVGVDVFFLRYLFWWRLITNVAIVAAFGVFYTGFLKNHL
jgi:hypothetical protein